MRDCQRCGDGETDFGTVVILAGEVRAKLCINCINEHTLHIAGNHDIGEKWDKAESYKLALYGRNGTTNPATEVEWLEAIQLKAEFNRACFAVTAAFVLPATTPRAGAKRFRPPLARLPSPEK